MEVRGRGGVRIEGIWAKDGPRAYLGAIVPEMPNLFMCYGPNSNNFGGFTVLDLLELEGQFALRCIAGLIETGQRSVEVTPDGYWHFAAILDEMERKMIYMDPRANNYYQHDGRSCVNGPLDIRRMWCWLNNPAGQPLPKAMPVCSPTLAKISCSNERLVAEENPKPIMYKIDR